MPPNPYDNCPCGSGKKFKWCCTAYWDKIEFAIKQQERGQHDGAIRSLTALVAERPDVPQIRGYLAQMLFSEGKTEEAEAAIDAALALDPNFPLAFFLRGLFRRSEGENEGSLLLFRKAAEAYPPEATDHLAQVYELIARGELLQNRLLASRAALAKACRYAPQDAELREQFEAMFGTNSRMPDCARKEYTFRPTAKPVVVAGASGKFSDALKGYEALATQVPNDPATWFNLGLVQAWLGQSLPAIESLTKSLDLEYDDARAEETSALLLVVDLGAGLDRPRDDSEHIAAMEIRDPNAVMQAMRAIEREGKMLAPQADEESGVFSFLFVEPIPSIIETGNIFARVKANATVGRGLIRLQFSSEQTVRECCTELRDRLQLAIGEPKWISGPALFGSLAQEALAIPASIVDLAGVRQKMADYAANYFENVWAAKSRSDLGGQSPSDAAGDPSRRKRLLGLVRYREDCFVAVAPQLKENETDPAVPVYDFDRLRAKLGLEKRASSEVPPDLLAAARVDFGSLGAADLAALNGEALAIGEIEDAMRAAVKLGDRELAVRFARAGLKKPPEASKPDRYPVYLAVISAETAEGNTRTALKLVQEGEAYDVEHNGGKRANEYGLRTAQLLAKSSDFDGSSKAFDALIERNPDDGRYFVAAIETMLSGKQGARAIAFAERGLERASSTGNRDLEAACKELHAAAKKLGK